MYGTCKRRKRLFGAEVRKLLGLDFETQSLDIENTNATEVGAILIESYEPNEIANWVDGTPNKETVQTVIKELDQLIWEPGYPPQPKEIVELTGITDEMLKQGLEPSLVFKNFLFPLMDQADYIVAHNAQFDKGILYAVAKRYSLTVPEKPWVCTRTQVPYPERFNCRKLSHMALDHGIKMDGRELHRATSDVRLMLEVLGRYSFTKILDYIAEPQVMLRIVVPGPWEDKGVGKNEAAKLGYGWEKPRGYEYSGEAYPKCWVKLVKASQVEKEMSKTMYKVVKL